MRWQSMERRHYRRLSRASSLAVQAATWAVSNQHAQASPLCVACGAIKAHHRDVVLQIWALGRIRTRTFQHIPRLECGMELARSIPARIPTFYLLPNELRKKEQQPLAASKFPWNRDHPTAMVRLLFHIPPAYLGMCEWYGAGMSLSCVQCLIPLSALQPGAHCAPAAPAHTPSRPPGAPSRCRWSRRCGPLSRPAAAQPAPTTLFLLSNTVPPALASIHSL